MIKLDSTLQIGKLLWTGLITLIIGLIPVIGFSQAVLQWEQNYGGSDEDVANAIEPTNDGGYIIAGYTSSSDKDVSSNYGKYDYWIVKIDSIGKIKWERTFGGPGNDKAYDIEQTQNGDFVIAGTSNSAGGQVSNNSGGQDYWIVKINQFGQLKWEKNFGGNSADVATSIIESNNGGYLVGGFSRSNSGDVGGNQGGDDYWVIKLTQQGGLQWEQNFGGNNRDLANSIIESSNGGYLVAGWSYSNSGDVGSNQGNIDYWVIKLNQQGNLQWEQNFGGNSDDVAHSIIESNNGGYLVAGSSYSSSGDVGGNQGSADYWVTKVCPAVKADFTYQSNILSVKVNEKTKNGDQFNWYFEGGGKGNGKTNSYEFDTSGTFDVTLVAKSNCGDADTQTKQVKAVCPKIIAEFSANVINASRVEFTNQSLYFDSVKWYFGDVKISTQENPTHSYDSTGTYKVKLIVKHRCGYDTTKKQVKVTCPEISTSFQKAKQTNFKVEFDNTSDTIINNWKWSFPDGDTATIKNPSHQFRDTGTYLVCLQGSISCDTVTTCKNIQVKCPPDIDTSFTPEMSNGLTVKINDSFPNANNFQWQFGDGGSATTENPEHTYEEPGIYTISLKAWNPCDTVTNTKTIEVEETGLESSAQENPIKVYPSPANTTLTVEPPPSKHLQHYKIFTATGQAMKAGNFKPQQTRHKLEVAGLSKGIYLIRLKAKEGVYVKKFMVE